MSYEPFPSIDTSWCRCPDDPQPPWTGPCCRWYFPFCAIVGAQGCASYQDLCIPAALGVCSTIPVAVSAVVTSTWVYPAVGFVLFWWWPGVTPWGIWSCCCWKPKDVVGAGATIESTCDFTGMYMKCCCPVLAVIGQQGLAEAPGASSCCPECVHVPHDITMACCFGCCFTMYCWVPKARLESREYLAKLMAEGERDEQSCQDEFEPV